MQISKYFQFISLNNVLYNETQKRPGQIPGAPKCLAWPPKGVKSCDITVKFIMENKEVTLRFIHYGTIICYMTKKK